MTNAITEQTVPKWSRDGTPTTFSSTFIANIEMHDLTIDENKTMVKTCGPYFFPKVEATGVGNSAKIPASTR